MVARVQLTLAVGLALVALVLGAVLLIGPDSKVEGAPAQGLSVGPFGFVGGLRPPDIPPGEFTLRDEKGRVTSLAQFRGQVVVLTFLCATCGEESSITASQVRLALDDLEDTADGVPALAVSVDPANDTALNARRFLDEQSLTGRMRFLLGGRPSLAPIWADYGIRPQRAGDPPPGADARDLDPSAYVLLIDREGRQRIGFPLEELTPEGLAHDIRKLRAES